MFDDAHLRSSSVLQKCKNRETPARRLDYAKTENFGENGASAQIPVRRIPCERRKWEKNELEEKRKVDGSVNTQLCLIKKLV